MRKITKRTLCSIAVAAMLLFGSMNPAAATTVSATEIEEASISTEATDGSDASVDSVGSDASVSIASSENDSTVVTDASDGSYEDAAVTDGGTSATASSEEEGEISEESYEAFPLFLSGKAHIQSLGDRYETMDYDTEVLTLGTTGLGKRLEQITIQLDNNTGIDGKLQYRVHCQTYGWTKWVDAGTPVGTVGEGKRIEAVQMRLTGDLAYNYSIYYRAHCQSYGWNLGWKNDGETAGTEGEGKRIEALEVKLVKQGAKEPRIKAEYRVHRQTYGWESTFKSDGQVSGTVGEAKRLESIQINASLECGGTSPDIGDYVSGVAYKTYIQGLGWEKEWKRDGELSGTVGEARRLEAISITLTGHSMDNFDICYRVHAQGYGWLGWAMNGEPAGTIGMSKRLEAIQIIIVPKTGTHPGATYNGITSNTASPCIYTSTKLSSLEAFMKTYGLLQYNSADGKSNLYTLYMGNRNLYDIDGNTSTSPTTVTYSTTGTFNFSGASKDGYYSYYINAKRGNNIQTISMYDYRNFLALSNGTYIENYYHWTNEIYNADSVVIGTIPAFKNNTANDLTLNTLTFGDKFNATADSTVNARANKYAQDSINDIDALLKQYTGYGYPK